MIDNPLVRRALARTPSPAESLVIVLVALVLATAARAGLEVFTPRVTFVTFYPAVLACTLLAGWRYGVVSAVLGGLLALGMFADEGPGGVSFPLLSALGGLVAFFVSAAVIITTANALRRAVGELDDLYRRTASLNEQLRLRAGNTLAVVQAIARQTAHTAAPGEFADALEGRLAALIKANTLLTGAGEQQCEVHRLVNEACSPFFAAGALTPHGPRCRVPQAACLPLMMVLHELGTNALKHGALSAPGGQVAIRWQLDPQHGLLEIGWQELGGPPVSPPTRRGLGTTLLRPQRGLASVQLDYLPAGVRCEILVEGAQPA